MLPFLALGSEWRVLRLVGLVAEFRQEALVSNEKSAASSYIGPGDHGAPALQLGFNP